MTKVETAFYARWVISRASSILHLVIFLRLLGLVPVMAQADGGSLLPPSPPSGVASWSLEGLEALGPRYEGSQALASSFDLIEGALKACGLSPRRFPTEGAPGTHSYSSNLEVDLPGTRPDRLYVVVPVDTYAGEGASRGRGGLVLALGAAQALAAAIQAGDSLPISVSFVFLGAEHRWRRGEARSEGLGGAALIRQSQNVPQRAFLYLETDSSNPSFSLVNTSQALLSPWWIYDRVRLSLEAAGISYRVDANLMQIHRLGLGDRQGSLAPFLGSGLPAVELSGPPTGSRSSAAEDSQGVRSFSLFLLALAKANAGGFTDIWDRNYLSFQVLGKSFVIRETPYIGILVGLAAFVVLILLVLSVTHRKAAKAFLSRWPALLGQIAVIYLMAASLFLAARIFTGIEAGIFGSREYWLSSPSLFLLLRLASSFFLFLGAVLLLVNLRVLSANPWFYEMAALVVLFADFFVYSAILPPFIFYFAWAMLFVGLSMVLKRSHWTIICYGLMYLPFILLATTVLESPEMAFHRSFILPTFQEAVLGAAASLPFFVFTASPLLFFVKPSRKARRIAAAVFLALSLGLEAGAIITKLHAGDTGRQGPALMESLDQDEGIFVASLSDRRRLGDVDLLRGGKAFHFSSRADKALARAEDSRTYVRLGEKRTSFLGRSLVELRLSFIEAPYFVELELKSPDEIRFYDCSLPYEIALDGRSARIFVGAGPPSPLDIQITVPAGFEATLDLEASYLSALVPWTYPTGQRLGGVEERLHASWPLREGKVP